jgi:hypothetical protein
MNKEAASTNLFVATIVNLCLAAHFFKVFYKHFSNQKPRLLVSEERWRRRTAH